MSDSEKIYRCESCGGIMEFDIKTQMLKCPNCDTTIEIINDQSKIVEHTLTLEAERTIRVEEKESKTMECSGCGATIELGAHDTATKCPYCGSSYVLANEQKSVIIPDGVVPFKIDKNQVLLEFRNWIKKRWLAPNALKQLYQHGGFQGIYIPYWTFDSQVSCYYTAEGGKDRTRTYRDDEGNEHTETITDWYPTAGTINHFFDDVQVSATQSYKRGFFAGIEPFNFSQLASYSPEYISGYLSENYSIGLEDGHREAIDKMDDELVNMAAYDVHRRYDHARNIRINPDYSNETYKHLLLPIYSTTYTFKNKVYNVMINGQTGKIKGEYPKSPIKIAILIVLAIIIIVLIFYFKKK